MNREPYEFEKALNLLEKFERSDFRRNGLFYLPEAFDIIVNIIENENDSSLKRRAINRINTCENYIIKKVTNLIADHENSTFEELDYWNKIMQEIIDYGRDHGFGNDKEFLSKKEILEKNLKRAHFNNLSKQEQNERLIAALNKLSKSKLQKLKEKINATSDGAGLEEYQELFKVLDKMAQSCSHEM